MPDGSARGADDEDGGFEGVAAIGDDEVVLRKVRKCRARFAQVTDLAISCSIKSEWPPRIPTSNLNTYSESY
jgi:hypothetical protein